MKTTVLLASGLVFIQFSGNALTDSSACQRSYVPINKRGAILTNYQPRPLL